MDGEKAVKLKVKCLRCGKEFWLVSDSDLYSYYKYLKSYKIDCKFTKFEHECINGVSNSYKIQILEEKRIDDDDDEEEE